MAVVFFPATPIISFRLLKQEHYGKLLLGDESLLILVNHKSMPYLTVMYDIIPGNLHGKNLHGIKHVANI